MIKARHLSINVQIVMVRTCGSDIGPNVLQSIVKNNLIADMNGARPVGDGRDDDIKAARGRGTRAGEQEHGCGRDVKSKSSLHGVFTWVLLPNESSSATAATRRIACNRDGPPPFAAAHG